MVTAVCEEHDTKLQAWQEHEHALQKERGVAGDGAKVPQIVHRAKQRIVLRVKTSHPQP